MPPRGDATGRWLGILFQRAPFPSRWSMVPSGLRAVRLVASLLCFVSPAAAQLIPIKTIPIAQGDQFQIFPSNNLGLGGGSIALPDSLGDPFANPATTARLHASRVFVSPTVYSVAGNAGAGRSLPVAMLARRAGGVAGPALGFQQGAPRRPPQPGGGIVRSPLPPG